MRTQDIEDFFIKVISQLNYLKSGERKLLKRMVLGIMLSLLFVSMLMLASNVQPVKSEPKTWTVDDDGPADFHTIQDAVNAASDGDTIQVASGVYYEHVSLSGVPLIGEDADTTIIDGNGTGKVIQLSGPANVTGFTIRNGDYGVWVRTSWAPMPEHVGFVLNDNCIVDNNYGGVHLQGCGGNIVANNVIAGNTLFGIHLYHAGNNTIINNTVLNNGHGIDFYGNSNDNILRNNNMTDNKYNFGLILRGETRNWLFAGIVNDVDTSNTVNGKPIYYWVNRHNEQVPEDAGYVWLTDCNNVTVKGLNLSNNLQGILLLSTNNTVLVNNNVTSNVCGIYVSVFSSNNTIIGNTLKDNLNGIYLGDVSRFTTMRNNSISGGQMNFGVSPDIGRYEFPPIGFPTGLINDVDTSNTVDGKPIVYWINQHDRQVPKNAGYVMLINSTNILIEGLNISNNVQNIFLISTNNTVIANNSITNSIYGIDVRRVGYLVHGTYFYQVSFNTTVSKNMLVDNGVGICLRSNSSIISNNTLYRNPLGICLQDTSNSIISKNLVVASDLNTASPGPELCIFYYPEWPWERSRELMVLEIGGVIVGGSYNFVYGNTVIDSRVGLSMIDQISGLMGTSNFIFHNNFINNSFQAMEAARGRNYWDNGYPSGGNYWSDYTGVDFYSGPYQNETGSDGIGDTPYVITVASIAEDHYPLMNPTEYVPPIPPEVQVGVKAGDWIKYDYTITGWPPDSPYPEWMTIEFLSVEGTTVTIRVTMHMSDGTQQNQTMTVDIIAGGGALGTFSGLVIPANSTTGDSICITGYGCITIVSETTRAYAGANRTVVYAGFSQYGIQLTYYWDKQTGVMVESFAASAYMNTTAKATATNMWQAQPLLVGDLDNDGKVDTQDLAVAARAFGSYLGHPRWNPMADVNRDDKVNIIDLVLIAKNFGKTYP